MASAAQNAPISPSPSVAQEHAEAATICCSVFEKEIVPFLCRGHERADRKLTLSERSRITNAFFLAWRIILATPPNDLPAVQKHVASLPPTDLIYILEISRFILTTMDAELQSNIAKLMGYTRDGNVVERVHGVLQAAYACFEEVGMNGVHQPDYAPCGTGLFFDDWQEDYVKSPARAYQRLRS
ncbi:hypothetical protein K458DRAFT_425255 [Lentithecium fluviatile CBS 122367]|uniref:Uncharacterized protein n=1 Tax=Lentithecium fluviatile CBS 122367 TaxID=1168545 RepID=A0A6G1IBZ4_9PLEO|nr:hypothetical protein K458DRAFT_425255 [Lentithecium fluviatile CBS 122367]